MKTILCIDDQTDGLEIRKAFLEANGYRALIATTGREGLKLARSESIDLVLLDYKMEGADGFAVAQQLRQLHPRLPIILLSGYVLELPAGFAELIDGVVSKGRPVRELLAAIERVLGPAEKQPANRELADQLMDMSLRQVRRTRTAIRRTREQTERVRTQLDGAAKHRASRRSKDRPPRTG